MLLERPFCEIEKPTNRNFGVGVFVADGMSMPLDVVMRC